MARTKPVPIPELHGLSDRAARFLRRHPNQARQAMIAALEAVAKLDQGREAALIDSVPENLHEFLLDKEGDSTTVGVAEAARRLEVSRTTVYDWVRKGTLLAWGSGSRGLAIPVEQILGPRKVANGIAEVLRIIEDPVLAWEFLSSEWPFADDLARPIDKLRAGQVNDVIAAAPSFGTAMT